MEFNELYEKYYNDIFNWSLVKTKNFHDAEDLTQDIIFQLFKSFSREDVIIKLENYIWKIAYFTWCKKAKQIIKYKEIINHIDEKIFNNISDINQEGFLKILETEEIKTSLLREVELLNGNIKQCIKLYYFNNLSIKEISNKLDMNESLIKYYLFEGRKKLRRNLENVRD
jgi:RNA polymerase sigma factor (sigma-70 family)